MYQLQQDQIDKVIDHFQIEDTAAALAIAKECQKQYFFGSSGAIEYYVKQLRSKGVIQ